MRRNLGRPSPLHVRKVLWVCQEPGMAVECEKWGAGFRSARSPESLELDPDGRVPVRAGCGENGMETHSDDQNVTRADSTLPCVAAAC